MGFPIYLPWSQERTELAMRHARTDLFMLDVQLGSACNARCPRCDSACCYLNEPAALDLHALCGLAEEMNRRHLNWLAKNHLGTPPGGVNTGFICGLGEPTASHNMTKLKSLLRSTRSTNFSWSIFTNGIVWDDELENELKHGRLCVMVQSVPPNILEIAYIYRTWRKISTSGISSTPVRTLLVWQPPLCRSVTTWTS